MKKFSLYMAVIVLLSLTLSLILTNSKNINNVKVGMNEIEVKAIMGIPSIVSDRCRDTSQYSFQYPNNDFASSDDFHVYFSKKDSTVEYVHYGN